MSSHLRFMVVAASLLCLSAGENARAAVVSVVNDNGNLVSDFSVDNILDFDVDWSFNLPVTLEVQRTAGDTDSLAFSGTQFNFTGVPWTDFHLTILSGGAVWESINAIDPGFGGVDSVVSDATNVTIFFDPAVPDIDAVRFGVPALDDPDDWRIDISTLADGDSFQLQLNPSIAQNVIPEPSTMLIWSGGLLAVAAYRWRRRKAKLV